MPPVPVSGLSASPASNQSVAAGRGRLVSCFAPILSSNRICGSFPIPIRCGGGPLFYTGGGGAAAASLSFAPWSAWGRLLLAVVGGRRRVRRGRSILFSYLLIGFLYFI